MNINLLDWLSRLLRYITVAGAVSYIIAYVAVVFSRINHPFALMWLEGAYVDHVIKILADYKYYVSPSLEFVSSIYAPFYFYLSALLSKIIGVGFLPLRLISFVSSMGSLVIIYLMVKRITGDSVFGLLSSCLFASTFHLSGASFDIGRVDSLFLFLLLAALYVMKFNENRKAYFFAGVLISFSCLTKQTALVISLPIMAYCMIVNRQLAFSFIAPVILIVGLGSIIINYLHDGWYYYYAFELPRTTPVNNKILLTFWPRNIIMPLGISFSIGMFYLLHKLSDRDKKHFLFCFFVFSGVIVASWYSLYRKGYYNVMFPTYAFLSIMFGLGLHQLVEYSRSFSEDKEKLIKIFLYLLCIAQFSSDNLVYNPGEYIPSQKDLEAGKKLVKTLSEIEGDIFVPNHGYLAVLAGKKGYANIMGMRDVLFTNKEEHLNVKNRMFNELQEAMKEKIFSAIVLDSFTTFAHRNIERDYMLREQLFNDENVFYPVTSMKTRPDLIYIPKGDGFK